MLIIRLQRVGRKHDPSFRVIVTRSTNSAKTGRVLEVLGSHNPKTKMTELKADRIKEWIANGAQVSDTMRNMFITKGIMTGKKVNSLPKKRPIVSEKPAEEAAPIAAPVVAETASPESPVEESAVAESPAEEKAE
jgi:small subunit ribosomal protein S16